MANPTIGATTPRIQYTATGGQTVFTVPFEFLANADLAVYVNGTLQTLTTHYTLTGANTTGGGTLTFVTGRTAGDIVTILGNLAYSRDTNKYTKYGLLPAEVLEADFDAMQVQAKQLARDGQFALRAPLTDTGSPSMTLPVVATRASKVLGFDASGNPISSSSTVTAMDAAVTAINTIAGASSGSSASISHIASGTGALATTVQAKLREVVSAKDFGAYGDGSTSDQTAIANTIAAASKTALLPAGDYLVTSVSNNLGVEFDGPGRLVKAITGGQQQLNSYADKHQYVIGREYLSAFHKLLISKSAANIRFSGDSTTAGTGASASYFIDALMLQLAGARGFPYVTTTNAGHSGDSTVQWLASYLATDLAASPALYVIRWGINDPYTPGANLSVSQFLTNIRSGLATIRASKTLAQMSVILMMPNSVNDTPNNRDEKWHEAIRNGLVQAARDYQCCFVDTYAYLRDSRSAADWMDDPYGDGRHIHPANVMNLWITSLLGEVVFPIGLSSISEVAGVKNTGGSYLTKAVTDATTTYPYGISILRANSTFPYDGIVITNASVDNVLLQFNYPYTGTGLTISAYAVRIGQGGTWQSWQYHGSGGSAVDVSPAASFSLPAISENMGTYASDRVIVGKGFLNGPGAIVASGTAVATVTANHQPQFQVWWGKLLCWNGTTWEQIRCTISTGGVITTQQATTINCTRMYLDQTWFGKAV